MAEQTLWSLDRTEGDYAVLVGDDRGCVTVPLSDLPLGAREGKMYRLVGGIYVEDPAAEQVRRKRIQALQNRLRDRKK